jgi:hypothetical protein
MAAMAQYEEAAAISAQTKAALLRASTLFRNEAN